MPAKTVPVVPADTPDAEPRRRGSSEREIVNLFYEAMLEHIVDKWKTKTTEIENEVSDSETKKKRLGYSSMAKVSKGLKRPRQTKTSIDLSESLPPFCWWSVPDEKGTITFKNGNTYQGDISNKCMHGNGRYEWTDGTVYTGQFEYNQIKGIGTIFWKDTTWYTGEFLGNLRHGKGLYVASRNQRCYTGNWHFGAKHGQGAMYYSGDFKNFYDGEWLMNVRHGEGVRGYNGDSVYKGQFVYSTKEEKCEIIFSNHDYYKGDFKLNTMDGTGRYIWDIFRNETMCATFLNCYEGTWHKGKRHGYGLLQLGQSLCSHYKGKFHHNVKHGHGKLVSKDGLIIEDENLFEEDSYKPKNPVFSTVLTNCKNTHEHEIHLYGAMVYRYLIENAVKNYIKNVKEENSKLSLVNTYLERNGFDGAYSEKGFPEFHITTEEFVEFEDRCLRRAIKYYEERLFEIYRRYATILCDGNTELTRPLPYLLIRLYLWQFYYDCKLTEREISLAEIDNMIARNKRMLVIDHHDPFEPILFWQFVHSLLMIAIHLYVKELPGPKPDTMVANAFRYFMDNDVLPNVGVFKGSLIQMSFLPLKAIYNLYLSLGNPPTVLKFLCAAKRSPHLSMTHPQPPVIEANDEHLPRGKNCFLFSTDLIYLKERSYFSPAPESPDTRNPDLPLYNLGELSSKFIVQQFVKLIPNLIENDRITDINKEITFYEFFEALIACSEEVVKLHNKTDRLKEQEKRLDILLRQIDQEDSKHHGDPQERHHSQPNVKHDRKLFGKQDTKNLN